MRKFMVLLFVVASSSAIADELSISETETLSFRKPTDFRFEVAREPDDQFRPSLKFSHFGSDGIKDFGFKMFINKLGASDLKTERSVKDFAEVDCEHYKEGSVENAVILQKLPGENLGFYCSYTDASIPVKATLMPGQFRNITVGFVKSGVFGFNVMAFSNATKDPLFSSFISTLASLQVREKRK